MLALDYHRRILVHPCKITLLRKLLARDVFFPLSTTGYIRLMKLMPRKVSALGISPVKQRRSRTISSVVLNNELTIQYSRMILESELIMGLVVQDLD